MRVAQRFAGYSLEEADNLRKACGKKIRALIAAEREKFVAGCDAQGYGEELGTKLFDIIEPFADYAFNKSHSYGYGLVAYQTAWLKANHPGRVPRRAAVVGEGRQGQDRRLPRRVPHARHRGPRARRERVVVELHHAARARRGRRHGPRGDRVRAVGGAQRRRGDRRAHRRRAGGERAVHRLLRLLPPGRPGACSTSGRSSRSSRRARSTRSATRERGSASSSRSIIDRVARSAAARRSRASRRCSRCSEDESGGDGRPSSRACSTGRACAIPEVEFDKSERLAFEKEMLGLYVSDHPLLGLEAALRTADRPHDPRAARLRRRSGAAPVPEVRGSSTVGGVVTAL